MRLLFLGICLFSFSAAATSTLSFKNDREGKSVYSGRSQFRAINRILRRVDGQSIKDVFKDALDQVDEKKVCAFDLNEKIFNGMSKLTVQAIDLKGVIYYLRSSNEIDDVVAGILLNAYKVDTTEVPEGVEDLIFSKTTTKEDQILELITSFEKKYLKNSCFDEAYKSFISEIMKIDKRFKVRDLENLLLLAHQEKRISWDIFKRLEKARLNDLHEQILSLGSYRSKLKSLRLQYPLRDTDEKSDYVTTKVNRLDLSRRQKLLQNYSDLQIMIMGNIIKKLRARLESPKVEILVYDRENPANLEKITLEPMERFRFALKLLRKEMAHLKLNSYFNGYSPEYLDILAASYELGIIPASELEEIGGLEDIWNPKKSFWDKAQVWVQTFSSVATIVIPPPYGFIPALAVVVIQATTKKTKDQNTDDPASLF